MRNLLVAMVVYFFTIPSFSQSFDAHKPVVCDSTKAVIKFLSERYGEKPAWIAKSGDDDTFFTLFLNQKTGSWTLLQYTKETACVLGTGDSSAFPSSGDV